MQNSTEDEARKRRTRHPVALSIALGCYVLAALAGMFFLTGRFGLIGLIPSAVAHGVLLIVPLRKLGARKSGAGAALFIVATSLMFVFLATDVRDALTLRQRGERVTATVVKKWYCPGRPRTSGTYNYELEHQDGSAVPGPALKTSREYGVGEVLTVFEDPEGELRPKTPAQMEVKPDTLGPALYVLAAVGAVGWTAWRGSDAAARLRARRKEAAGMRRLTGP